MKGYRTIIFSSAMTLIGLLGFKVSPDTANHWMDVFVAIWGIGAILLRQFTTTPVGGIALLQSPGLSAEEGAQLRADILTLVQHSGISLQAAALTANLSQKIDAMADTLQAISAAVPLPGDLSQSGSVAATAVPAAVPVADDGGALAPAPSALAPAQPISPDAPAAVAIAGDLAEVAAIAPRIIPAL